MKLGANLWLTKGIPYLAHQGEIWGAFSEYFGKNWPCFNEKACCIARCDCTPHSAGVSLVGEVWCYVSNLIPLPATRVSWPVHVAVFIIEYGQLVHWVWTLQQKLTFVGYKFIWDKCMLGKLPWIQLGPQLSWSNSWNLHMAGSWQVPHLCSWFALTHWGRVTHIYVSKLTIIGSDNGLSPGGRQAIIWTNDGILLVRDLGTNFSEILIEIQTFSFWKNHLKVSSAKWRPFCLSLNESILNKNRKRVNSAMFVNATQKHFWFYFSHREFFCVHFQL